MFPDFGAIGEKVATFMKAGESKLAEFDARLKGIEQALNLFTQEQRERDMKRPALVDHIVAFINDEFSKDPQLVADVKAALVKHAAEARAEIRKALDEASHE